MENNNFAESLRNLNKQPIINEQQYKVNLRLIMEGIKRDTKRTAQKGIHKCKGYLSNAGWDDDSYGISEAPDFSGLKNKLSVRYLSSEKLYTERNRIPIDNTIVFLPEEIDRYISDICNELKKLGFNNFTCRKDPYKKYHYYYSDLKTTSRGLFREPEMYYELIERLEKSGYAIYVYINW